jgi:hypothetical protein
MWSATPQVDGNGFLEHALAAGLVDGSYGAGQQTDFNRMLLFAMEKPPQAAQEACAAGQWQRIRWQMLRASRNAAALPGVVGFIAHCLKDEVTISGGVEHHLAGAAMVMQHRVQRSFACCRYTVHATVGSRLFCWCRPMQP